MIVVGVVFHLAIAATWAGIYFVVASRARALRQHWVQTGLVYGIVVWMVMNLVVVPLSRTSPIPYSGDQVFAGIVILMLCVGLPIARAGHKHFNDAVNTGSVFFVIFLYTKFFDWWWDVMPKYLFFLVLGLTAVLLLFIMRRLRARGLFGGSAR